jgi:hypothetical protein
MDKKEQINHFLKKLAKIQPTNKKEVGLIVASDDEQVSQIEKNLNSDTISAIDLDDNNKASTELLKEIVESLKQNQFTILAVGDKLSPKLYNQIYLASKNGRIHFIENDKNQVVDINKENQLVLLISQKNLDNLSYDNIVDLAGPVLRLKSN